MERQEPPHFTQKPLDLFSDRHGRIDARSFVEGARRFAVVRLAAGAVSR
jgi:hypothetical protein